MPPVVLWHAARGLGRSRFALIVCDHACLEDACVIFMASSLEFLTGLVFDIRNLVRLAYVVDLSYSTYDLSSSCHDSRGASACSGSMP